MKNSNTRVALVELQPSLPSTDKYLVCPSYGLVLLGSILKKKGYDVLVFVEGVSPIIIKELIEFDYICFNIKSSSAKKTYRMADSLRLSGKKIIFGGTHASYFAKDCLKHCDYVVPGEADDALPKLIESLQQTMNSETPKVSCALHSESENIGEWSICQNINNVADYSLVSGLAKKAKRTGRYFPKKRIMMPVQSSRGCPNSCSFCIVDKMFGPGYRKRPVDTVLSEIKSALRYTEDIFFVDNNFIGSSHSDIEQTKNLLRGIIETKLKINAIVFVTIEIASKKHLLELMYKAGIRTLMIGLESINKKTLSCYRKDQSPSEMEKNLHQIKKHGFKIIGSFLAGNNGDSGDEVIQATKLAIQWEIDQLCYFMLSPYPDMNEVIPKHRVFLNDWDFATGHHLYFFPLNISPSRLQEAVIQAVLMFYSKRRIFNLMCKFKFMEAKNFTLKRIMFQRICREIQKNYIPFLKEMEKGYYESGKLDESLLMSNKPYHIPCFDEL